jgi:hypothetical protein
VQALLAAGYVVYAISPMQVARYRERHSTSGRSQTPRMLICWPSSSGSTGSITARSPAIVKSPSTSRSPPGPPDGDLVASAAGECVAVGELTDRDQLGARVRISYQRGKDSL